jgi:organic hydroperoxide reductase OsmC/OhrA
MSDPARPITRPEPHDHHYTATCSWSGSTAVGYDAYSRAHTGHAPPAAAISLSSDPAFLGDPALLSPEQLVVLAAVSCQLLSFLAVAARARIDVRDYQDTGTAVMTEDGRGGSITEIVLRPRVTVVTAAAPGALEDRLRRLTHLAHEQCYIAATLRCPITVEPTFDFQQA